MDSIHRITTDPLKGKEFERSPGESSTSSPPLSDEATIAHVEDAYALHAEHGPPIDNELAEEEYEEEYQHHPKLWWGRMRHHIRDPAAEFLGTFTMIVFGDGSVAQVVLSHNPNLPVSSQNKGEYQSISWGWG
jgi:hypothetical protein